MFSICFNRQSALVFFKRKQKRIKLKRKKYIMRAHSLKKIVERSRSYSLPGSIMYARSRQDSGVCVHSFRSAKFTTQGTYAEHLKINKSHTHTHTRIYKYLHLQGIWRIGRLHIFGRKTTERRILHNKTNKKPHMCACYLYIRTQSPFRLTNFAMPFMERRERRPPKHTHTHTRITLTIIAPATRRCDAAVTARLNLTRVILILCIYN